MASLKAILAAYIREHQARARKERAWFEKQPSFEDAVRVAALAQDRRGKRLSHQRRIPGAVLLRCKERLRASIPEMQTCKTFDELHETVRRAIAGIRGAGELYCYDTALPLGSKLDKSPELVYLHAGARDGAVKLGFKRSRTTVHSDELPRELRAIEPEEIEDVLCIYENQLGGTPLQGSEGCGTTRRQPVCYPPGVKRDGRVC